MARQRHGRDFDMVGGLKEHIKVLKEMIIYPLMYRELFESYGIQTPRGVLFHGPPGTGKTLTAGAVAAECSKSSSRRVSFYTRKGADCLNKYIGESEKHLQNLFTQAYNTRPSIIFFDEIDGLVPTRSDTQEQVHASIVSTLLALMDGLDSKSEVFVIGATNRIDMIDPALRRPGRFDRELYFPLPPFESRVQIFRIHTRDWKHKPSEELIYKLASECAGYCGADIQSLCSQAVMKSFHRHFPQIADTSRKYSNINFQNLQVEEDDFWEAKLSTVPASQRTYVPPSRPLSPELEPLLRRSLDNCLNHILKTCPFKFLFHNRENFLKNRSLSCPRFLLMGKEGNCHISHVAPAILHCFDHLPVTLVDMSTLNDDNSRSSDSSSLLHKLEEARQCMPSIVYFRDMSSWWGLIDDSAKQVLIASVEALDTSSVSKIFLFGSTYASSYESLSSDVKKLFPKSKSFFLSEPMKDERSLFFSQLLLGKILMPPKVDQGPLFSDVECDTAGELDSDGEQKRRRSLRQKGLGVEYLGLSEGNRTALNVRITCDTDRRHFPLDELDVPAFKRLKFISSINNADSSNASNYSASNKEIPSRKTSERLRVDSKRLQELLKTAVEVTSTCRVNSIINLYEELEIVALRYSSEWDRTSLPEELNREISIFTPT